jgi:pyrroloquinoline quinone biosynthesis protein B
VDPENKKSYLFEATPDIATQIDILKTKASHKAPWLPDAIFLTHAHIGHYTGLMDLGKEAMNTDRLPVFCMPGMKLFLEENGPWSQLVSAGNISLQEINNKQQLRLTPNIAVEPFLVPHRDEYSETVGYKITGPNISVLFIPDIDKWTSWETDIVAAIYEVDYAFLDATFYDGEEIDNRDISEIPHPFVIESLALFRDLPDEERSKINFIHFNHTNPLLNIESAASRQLLDKGYHIARLRQTLKL